MSKNNQVSNEDLAMMIKEGFDNVDKRFGNVEGRLDGVEGKLDGVEGRLENLERGQDEIKMKMAYVAWDIDMRELARRVERIEKHIDIRG